MIEYLTQACSVSWGNGEKAARPELEALKQRLWVTILWGHYYHFCFLGHHYNFFGPIIFFRFPNILLIFLRSLYQFFSLDHDCCCPYLSLWLHESWYVCVNNDHDMSVTSIICIVFFCKVYRHRRRKEYNWNSHLPNFWVSTYDHKRQKMKTKHQWISICFCWLR